MRKKPIPNRIKLSGSSEYVDDFMPQLGGHMALELSKAVVAARKKPNKAKKPQPVAPTQQPAAAQPVDDFMPQFGAGSLEVLKELDPAGGWGSPQNDSKHASRKHRPKQRKSYKPAR